MREIIWIQKEQVEKRGDISRMGIDSISYKHQKRTRKLKQMFGEINQYGEIKYEEQYTSLVVEEKRRILSSWESTWVKKKKRR